MHENQLDGPMADYLCRSALLTANIILTSALHSAIGQLSCPQVPMTRKVEWCFCATNSSSGLF
jgi:hypothetical protein